MPRVWRWPTLFGVSVLLATLAQELVPWAACQVVRLLAKEARWLLHLLQVAGVGSSSARVPLVHVRTEARVSHQPTTTCARVSTDGRAHGVRGERTSVPVPPVTMEARVSATMTGTVVSVPVGTRAIIAKRR